MGASNTHEILERETMKRNIYTKSKCRSVVQMGFLKYFIVHFYDWCRKKGEKGGKIREKHKRKKVSEKKGGKREKENR